MTRASILEYVEAVWRRYFRVSRKEKGKILDKFTKVAGYHWKAAIRLIHWDNQPGQATGKVILGSMVLLWWEHRGLLPDHSLCR